MLVSPLAGCFVEREMPTGQYLIVKLGAASNAVGEEVRGPSLSE
jgi:hypothetical protein